MVVKYIPNRGDIIWMDFDPVLGHEQSGRRPALIISHFEYNKKTRLAIVCPITSKTKHYTHEVDFKGKNISGVILADQIRNIDWENRKAEFVGSVTSDVLDEVEAKLLTLIRV